MPRTTSKTSLTLHIPEATKESIQRVQVHLGAESMTEVIRRVFPLVEHLLIQTPARGTRIILRDADGTERDLAIIA